MLSLIDLGLAPACLAGVDQSLWLPGRIIEEQKNAYRVVTELSPDAGVWASVAGRLRHSAESRLDLPAVGDFVLLRRRPDAGVSDLLQIGRVLPRHSCFTRRAEGGEHGPASAQVIAANIDVLFIVMSLNQNFNERRLERYVVAAWESGAVPVVLVSKVDLVGSDLAARDAALASLRSVALQVQVHLVSSLTGEGMGAVRGHLGRGRTGALVGSSGVGKSTLLNALVLGAELSVQPVRAGDDRGRHTTSHRSLWVLAGGGGILIDTPGMRTLVPMEGGGTAATPGASPGEPDGGGGLNQTFADIVALILRCRFTNCNHEAEPGCAVKAEIAAGALSLERYASYRKLEREAAYTAKRAEARRQTLERRKRRRVPASKHAEEDLL